VYYITGPQGTNPLPKFVHPLAFLFPPGIIVEIRNRLIRLHTPSKQTALSVISCIPSTWRKKQTYYGEPWWSLHTTYQGYDIECWAIREEPFIGDTWPAVIGKINFTKA